MSNFNLTIGNLNQETMAISIEFWVIIFLVHFWWYFHSRLSYVITSQRLFLSPIENTLNWLPGSSKGCRMDDKGCPYTIPWIQTKPLGRCWYAIEDTLNWSWPEIFPFHVLFLSQFFKLLESIFSTYHKKNPGETNAWLLFEENADGNFGPPNKWRKISCQLHTSGLFWEKRTYNSLGFNKKCMFFFSCCPFFEGSCAVPFLLSLKIVRGFRCVFRAKRWWEKVESKEIWTQKLSMKKNMAWQKLSWRQDNTLKQNNLILEPQTTNHFLCKDLESSSKLIANHF